MTTNQITKRIETWYTPEYDFWNAMLIDDDSLVNPVGMAIGFSTEEEAEKQAIMDYNRNRGLGNEAVQE